MNRTFVNMGIYTIVSMAYVLLMLAVHHGSTELTLGGAIGAAIVGASTGLWRRQPFLGLVVLTGDYVGAILILGLLS